MTLPHDAVDITGLILVSGLFLYLVHLLLYTIRKLLQPRWQFMQLHICHSLDVSNSPRRHYPNLLHVQTYRFHYAPN